MDRKPIEYRKHCPIRTGAGACPNCYTVHGEMLETLCDYNWREAFTYATFEREDVKRIIYLSEGENDGAAWICLVQLKNNKYGAINAWCDYTGWD